MLKLSITDADIEVLLFYINASTYTEIYNPEREEAVYLFCYQRG